jgi:Helix-turn-helix domain
MTIVTKEDLELFRIQLLDDIRQVLISQEVKPTKPWLKNDEVKKLLDISTNTLQRLRVSGKLRFSKVGGIHYYRYEDIEKLLNNRTC